jgi:hypothetical protein
VTGDTPDHNVVLKAAAREVLGPLGLSQRGRSRVWYDDRQWFVISVEFQPSSWSRGSYLNVAASWMWWPGRADVGFDYGHGYRHGHRVHPFESAEAGDWEATCIRLAKEAGGHCLALRDELVDLPAAARLLNRQRFATYDFWRKVNAGIAAALAGDAALAHHRLQQAQDEPRDLSTGEWAAIADDMLRQLLAEVDDLDRFREARMADILACRGAVRLPTLSRNELQRALLFRAPNPRARRSWCGRLGVGRRAR